MFHSTCSASAYRLRPAVNSGSHLMSGVNAVLVAYGHDSPVHVSLVGTSACAPIVLCTSVFLVRQLPPETFQEEPLQLQFFPLVTTVA